MNKHFGTGLLVVTALLLIGASDATQPVGSSAFPVDARICRIKALPNDRALAISLSRVWELNAATGKITGNWELPKRLDENEICALSDHQVAYCEESNGRQLDAVIYDFKQKKVTTRIPLERGWEIGTIGASPSGSTVGWIEEFNFTRVPEIPGVPKKDFARVKTLDVATGKIQGVEIPLYFPDGQHFHFFSVAVDETTVATGGDEGEGALYLIDMKTSKLLWKTNESSIDSVAFTSDGKSVFSCDTIGQVIRWDTATGKKLSTWTLLNDNRIFPRTLPDLVRAIAVSPDGTLVSAATFGSRRLVVWDLATGKPVEDLRLPESPIESACSFADDSKGIWFSRVTGKTVNHLDLRK